MIGRRLIQLTAATTMLAFVVALAAAYAPAQGTPKAPVGVAAAPPASPASHGQAGMEGTSPPATPIPTQQELIQAVVAQLNARAVPPKQEIGESGDEGEAPEQAAITIFGAEGGPCSVDVALVAADSAVNTADVSGELLGDARIASVTTINTVAVTPTTAELRAFDAVLVWTNSTPLDNVALGDNLADYTDAGGGVVLGMFAMQASLATRIIGGRFLTDDYYCIESTIAGSITGAATLGVVDVLGSPMMAGVGSFNGGTLAFRPSGALHPLATRIAAWSTGENLVASRNDLSGRRVDLGFFPVSSAASGGSWVTNGDRLMANALAYVGGCPNVGSTGCAPSRFAQTPFNPLDTGRNSGTPASANTQQIADSFSVAGGATIEHITLWGLYIFNNDVPLSQRFTVNIHANTAGNPGAIIYTATVTVTPEYTGSVNTAFVTNPARIYRFSVDLPTPFVAAPGVTYWLSPLGDNPGIVWAWQFVSDAVGTFRSRANPAAAWGTFTGNLAFQLCGRCDCACSGDVDGDGDVDVDDLIAVILGFGACP